MGFFFSHPLFLSPLSSTQHHLDGTLIIALFLCILIYRQGNDFQNSIIISTICSTCTLNHYPTCLGVAHNFIDLLEWSPQFYTSFHQLYLCPHRLASLAESSLDQAPGSVITHYFIVIRPTLPGTTTPVSLILQVNISLVPQANG